MALRKKIGLLVAHPYSTRKDISGRYLQTASDDGIAENVSDFQSAPEMMLKRRAESVRALTRVERRLRQPMPPMMRRGLRPIS